MCAVCGAGLLLLLLLLHCLCQQEKKVSTFSKFPTKGVQICTNLHTRWGSSDEIEVSDGVKSFHSHSLVIVGTVEPLYVDALKSGHLV